MSTQNHVISTHIITIDKPKTPYSQVTFTQYQRYCKRQRTNESPKLDNAVSGQTSPLLSIHEGLTTEPILNPQAWSKSSINKVGEINKNCTSRYNSNFHSSKTRKNVSNRFNNTFSMPPYQFESQQRDFPATPQHIKDTTCITSNIKLVMRI